VWKRRREADCCISLSSHSLFSSWFADGECEADLMVSVREGKEGKGAEGEIDFDLTFT
jgi:hypothetical protein